MKKIYKVKVNIACAHTGSFPLPGHLPWAKKVNCKVAWYLMHPS